MLQFSKWPEWVMRVIGTKPPRLLLLMKCDHPQ